MLAHAKDVRSGQPLFCNQPPRGSYSEPEIARESQSEPERARVSQRKPEWTRESQSEPERARVSQRKPEWTRESLREPERAWESQREPQREPQRFSLALPDSLWLTLALSLAHSGSLWLTLALSGSLSGSLWLSLALSGSLWLSLALSDSLWLSLALSLSPDLLTKPLLGSQGPCSARSIATALQHFIQLCRAWEHKNKSDDKKSDKRQNQNSTYIKKSLPIIWDWTFVLRAREHKNKSDDKKSDKRQNQNSTYIHDIELIKKWRSSCICLAFRHCAFSNVSSKHLHRRMKSHTGCILFGFFPLCVFKCLLKALA